MTDLELLLASLHGIESPLDLDVVRYGHLAPLRGRGPLVQALLLLHEDRLQLWHLGNGEDVVQAEVDVALLEERIAQALSWKHNLFKLCHNT